MNIPRLGTAGWSIPRACAGRVPGSGSHLERYAQVFSCAEINSTFYRPPRPATWSRWAASVPTTFRFSVKAPKTMTHEMKLVDTRDLLLAFLDQARLLGEKLGPLLFQLPPKLAFDFAVVEEFFALLRQLHLGPVACEPRHATWFSSEADALLQQLDIARVAADPPVIPRGNSPGGSLGLRYFRLHGSPRVYYSAYSPQFLAALALTLRQEPAAEAWCIFDNTASGAALEDALTLQNLLRAGA